MLQGGTHRLYAMEMIIIPLKLHLIAMFLLHGGRVVYAEKTQNSIVKLSTGVFFRNIYRSDFNLVKSMLFVYKQG